MPFCKKLYREDSKGMQREKGCSGLPECSALRSLKSTEGGKGLCEQSTSNYGTGKQMKTWSERQGLNFFSFCLERIWLRIISGTIFNYEEGFGYEIPRLGFRPQRIRPTSCQSPTRLLDLVVTSLWDAWPDWRSTCGPRRCGWKGYFLLSGGF